MAVWLIATAQAALAEKRIALVIGNSNYTLAPLENPKNDADDVSAALQRLHFDVSELKDLTVSKFDEAIDAFEAKAKDADVAFFFFSGHGVQIDKRGYLAPVDIKAESESSALRELEPVQEIISRIENAARISVIVLDACRNSALHERLRRIAMEKNRGFSAKGLPPVSVVGSNTLVVYATVPGETASDGTGRNSPFTAALLRNIETPSLDIELMFKRVTANVLNLTGGRQQPERLSRLQNELMLAPATPQASEAAAAFPLPKDMPPAEITRPNNATAIFQTPIELQTCDGVFVSVAEPEARLCIKPGSGQSFKDCPDCPEMVIAPSGKFLMGWPENKSAEGPQHKVTIPKPFAVGKFAVTFAEWDACVERGGCGGYRPSDQNWGRGDRPVINVSWDDAKSYVSWLSKKTGHDYRLLSEAEREYVTLAGEPTVFWWGPTITPEQANYNGTIAYQGGRTGDYPQKTMPVKSFEPNHWGLYQVHGNVWEWVEDCWHDSYSGAPENGSVWATEECKSRVLRGGSWFNDPSHLRAACRVRWDRSWWADGRERNVGFRVARTLDPP